MARTDAAPVCAVKVGDVLFVPIFRPWWRWWGPPYKVVEYRIHHCLFEGGRLHEQD